MTTRQLTERIERWQRRLSMLGIDQFRIESVTQTDEIPAAKTAIANAGVSVSENYDIVHFYFNTDFVSGASKQTLDETIIHEWLHVAFRDLDNTLSLVRPWMPEATFDMYDDQLFHIRESLIDRLARALYALHAKNC